LRRPIRTVKTHAINNVAIFTRVSKQSQDFQRQISDLQSYADRMGYHVVDIISEKISGAKNNSVRKGITQLMDLAKAGKINRVLVSEVSRLGRKTSEVLKTVEDLKAMGISVFIQNHNIETINTDGSNNSMAQMFLTLLAEFARMERETLIERINSGLEEAKRKGVVLGRREGTTKDRETLLKENRKVVEYLRTGKYSIREIAKLCINPVTKKPISTATVQKIKKALAAS
jgi:DNA invertase Pin-like site-specific DNA recombinase